MALAIALLASTFSTAVAKYESFDSAIAAPARSTFSTNSSTTGTVQLDHSLSSTHKNNSALKISWSSTSGSTVYYSVAVKELMAHRNLLLAQKAVLLLVVMMAYFRRKNPSP